VLLLEPERTPYDLSWRMGGINVRIHPVFWLVSAIMGWSSLHFGFEYLILWIACVFVSILIHELGHVMMGRAFGYDGHIVLYGFGGLAIGSNAMASRWQRILVSFAGPLAGFLYLGIIVVGFLWLNPDKLTVLLAAMKFQLGLIPGDGWTDRVLAQELLRIFTRPTLTEQAFLDLFFINLFWGLMNLLPIWPLDGGQISRDFLGWFLPGNGLRVSLGISFLLAALLALNALLVTYDQPHLPLLGWLGGTYLAILFGLLAFQSFQLLQQVESNRRSWHQDEGTPWERDPTIWRR
jgi:stage IV sporulation protein FB